MKAYRVFYYLLLIGALSAGLYTGSRLCFLLVLVQLFTLAAAFGLNLWTLLSFSYTQEISAPEAEKGRTVTLHLGIYNDKPFPFTHMRVRITAPDPRDCREIPIELAPRKSAAFELPLALPRRGEYQIGMTRVDIQDIFGLLPMHLDMRRLPYYRLRTLLVTPRLLPFPLPASAASAESRTRALELMTGEEELSHLRAFVPGDSLARVHWKASLKLGSLMTRQQEDPSGGWCLIALDTRPIGEDGDELADRITECAAAVLRAHLQQQDRVRILCPDSGYAQPEPVSDLQSLQELLRWLALLPFRAGEDGEELAVLLAGWMQAERPACVYVLGAEPDEQSLALLREADVPCFYWVAKPLPEGTETAAGHLRAASFYGTEMTEFLARRAEEERL